MNADPHTKLAPLTLGKGRIEALSDGVFAIAMTLLVLELKIPDLPKQTTQAEVLLKLKEMLPHFYSYAMTFVLSGVFWVFHHLTFHFIRHTTRALLWMNIIFLMFVSLLPFSTHFMADFMHYSVAMMFYFGNQTVLALLLRAQWIYAVRAGILEIKTDERWGSRFPTRVNALMLACAAAFVTACFHPRASQNVFLFALIAGLIFERFYNRRSQNLLSKKALDGASAS